MSMKQIVFFGVAILIVLVIIGWMLHSMAHVDEINQKRREQEQGEALASRIITTTATTSIWDVLRQSETVVAGTGTEGSIPAESGEMPAESLPDGEELPTDEENPEEETSPEEELPEEENDVDDVDINSPEQTITETLQ